MPFAFAVLVGQQLVGQAAHLPLPGPLIGMVLLTIPLVARGRAGAAAEREIPPRPQSTSIGLIVNMPLLFAPAGVGVIAKPGVLRRE